MFRFFFLIFNLIFVTIIRFVIVFITSLSFPSGRLFYNILNIIFYLWKIVVPSILMYWYFRTNVYVSNVFVYVTWIFVCVLFEFVYAYICVCVWYIKYQLIIFFSYFVFQDNVSFCFYFCAYVCFWMVFINHSHSYVIHSFFFYFVRVFVCVCAGVYEYIMNINLYYLYTIILYIVMYVCTYMCIYNYIHTMHTYTYTYVCAV